MTVYQVTAKFGNIFEVCGPDACDYNTALDIFQRYANVGRAVRLHAIAGESSRVLKQANY